jgi:hypothetical protein
LIKVGWQLDVGVIFPNLPAGMDDRFEMRCARKVPFYVRGAKMFLKVAYNLNRIDLRITIARTRFGNVLRGVSLVIREEDFELNGSC